MAAKAWTSADILGNRINIDVEVVDDPQRRRRPE